MIEEANSAARFLQQFHAVEFDQISGWDVDNHSAAFASFLHSARRMKSRQYTTKGLGVDAARLAETAAAALALEFPGGRSEDATSRDFFERHFAAFRYQTAPDAGFVTGYFEPELRASRQKTGKFIHPVHARPKDLIDIDDTSRPESMDDYFMFAAKTDQGLVEYMDRAAINAGGLEGAGLEIFWLEDKVDLFFVHIQGSARLSLPDGSKTRISYSAKTGHPFTAIGKLLVDMGELPLEKVTMATIKQWLRADEIRGNALMDRNQSYIFFQEVKDSDMTLGPVAAAGVPLSAGRSIAVDHRLHTFGTPVFINTRENIGVDGAPWSRLMIAQDTGSAIVGPARGDLFIGSGDWAGEIAGSIKSATDFTILVPRSQLQDVP